MRITRKDVAEMAQVSTTTVTNVINRKKNVSEDVRQRVLKIITECNYRPNLVARSLITNKSHHVAVMLDDITDAHHGHIVDAFQREASKNGYFMSICIRAEKIEDELDAMVSRGIDGAFLMISPDKFHKDDAMKCVENVSNYMKIVTGFNCHRDTDRLSSIECDFGASVEKAVDYLISLGHKNIAFLSIFDSKYPYDERYPAFLKTMSARLGVERPAVVSGTSPYPGNCETGMLYTEKLLKNHPETTAILCANDMLAIGCQSYLLKNGYKIPGDISLISIGGTPVLEYNSPPITSMSVNHSEYGKQAFRMLMNSIETEVTCFSSMKIDLEVRSSTGAPKSAV